MVVGLQSIISIRDEDLLLLVSILLLMEAILEIRKVATSRT